jgi:ABC-type bacteriocin/lantibiotic exporter with double-glycine peptidase domain
MPSKPPFHKQETPYSCVPACLRMVFASLGRQLSEAELRALYDCTPFGTEAVNAVDAARQLGFAGTGKHTLSFDELDAQVRRSLYPIAFVNTRPIDGILAGHALAVTAIDQRRVSVYDPLHGERHLPRATFESAWAMMHNLAILVQR